MLKVLSLFSGIGAFEKALDNLEVEYELVGYCEIDKYASKSYAAIHGVSEEMNLWDVLEDEVDEKYYLSDQAIQGRLKTNFGQYKLEKNIVNDKDVHPTILARYEGAPTLLKVEKEATIIAHNVPQTVKVRKFEVDVNALQECLHKHKTMSCKKIAWELDVPVSQIEHYFRKDKYFAIPDADIWLKLKALLHIETDEFDEVIMTFEEKEGVYEKANRVYDSGGISATLTRSDADIKVFVREATKQGYAEAFEGDSVNLEHPNSKTRRGRVGKQVAQTLTTSCNQGVVVGNNDPKIEVVGNYSPSGHDASRIVSSEGIAPTVKENHGTVTAIVEPTIKHRRVAKTSGKRR